MKKRSTHDKCLINNMPVLLLLLVLHGSTHFCNTKSYCERRWRKRGTALLFKVAVQMDDPLPHTYVEDMYHSNVAAFAKGFEQLETPASRHTTDLPSEMTT